METIALRSTNLADFRQVRSALRTQIDPALVVIVFPVADYRLSKVAPWTVAETTLAQTIIDTTAPSTIQSLSKDTFDSNLELRAVLLTLLQETNRLRAALVPPLPQVTVAQAIAAVKANIDTLT